MKRLALALVLLPSVVGLAKAQQTTKRVQLPTVLGVTRAFNFPFGHEKIRYQQLYSGTQFGTTIKQPVRITGLEFFGAAPAGVTLDIEVAMANGPGGLAGTFAGNMVSKKVVVVPRTKITPSGMVLSIPFQNDWIYFGGTNVVVDIRIYGNGRAGTVIQYPMRATILRSSNTSNVYRIGDPNATSPNSPAGTAAWGLVTRFSYQEGGAYPYGTGCRGGRNFQPVGAANAVPLPGLKTYTQQLTNASSGYPAIFFIGVSNKTFNGLPLPFPLTFLGGRNCNMLASPDFIVFTKTSGGGPGTGHAQVNTPIPAIGTLGGVMVYSQWVVFDKTAPNGNLSATAGLLHVIGS